MDDQLNRVCDRLKWSCIQLDNCRSSVEHPNQELERTIKLRERQVLKLKRDLKEANEEIFTLKAKHEEEIKAKDDCISKLKEQVMQLENELDIAVEMKSKPNKTDDHLMISKAKSSAQIREVSETYNELYDTHHSLAFEELERKMNEEEIVNILLKTLYDVMKYTEEARQEKLFRLRNPTLESAFEKYVSHSLKSNRGEIAKHYDLIKPYVRKCFEICWQISGYKGQFQLQRGAKNGDTFSADTYKTFTKTGETIDYIVWPPLLYIDSDCTSVVCKGVAQCQK
ncbi:uncharacterized protein LOC123558855 [Mercenaria mercenaria]|uniref:uncharacterized protein LOC123558855 n=1 Tax=Mercenaria mercenaria TaxID=6596 RepID=UPI001E1DCC1C|nr:uncharacterized protein LOC123558855 [Mercenaria mercenaria]